VLNDCDQLIESVQVEVLELKSQIYETVLSKDLSFQQKKAFIDKIAQMMKNVPSVIELKLAPIMIEVHSTVMTNSVKNGRE
jgi:predicted transport protein